MTDDNIDPALASPSDDELEGVRQAAARESIAQLLAMRGIGRVVNVDDGNPSAEQSEIDLESVIAALTATVLTIEMLASSEATQSLVLDEDGDPVEVEVLLDRLREVPMDFSEPEAQALTDAARLIGQASETGDRAADDDASSEEREPVVTDLETLSDLARLFPTGIDFQPLTLGEWRVKEDTILAETTPVLILFDRDFQREGGRVDEGEGLIAGVLSKNLGHVYCGLLTHSATSDDAERQLTQSVAKQYGLTIVDVIVMAKHNVTHQPLELANKLKAAIVARELRDLRTAVCEAVEEASKNSREELGKLDAYTVLALIEAASKEGAHEADNLIRLANSRGRRILDSKMRDEAFMTGTISQLRKTRTVPPIGYHLHQPTEGLHRHRHQDSFDDEEHLAQLRLPLEPGDIFELAKPTELLAGHPMVPAKPQRFILLSQHCDTIIRENGQRHGHPKTLAAAPLEKFAESDKERPGDFLLSWFEPEAGGERWWARLGHRVQLPAKALDACVLHPQGFAVIQIGQSPSPMLTSGWECRHNHLQKWASKQVRKLRDLETSAPLQADLRNLVVESLTGTSTEVHNVRAAIQVDEDGGVIAFGLRRIARLTDSNTRALITLASHHTGRPAADGPLAQEPAPPEPLAPLLDRDAASS